MPHETYPVVAEANQAFEQVNEISMRYARTTRLTAYPDGRNETDSEHSISLAMVAVELASRYYPQLDLGKLALLAVVHDLDEIEAVGGDTPTLNITYDGLSEKKQREAEARQRLRASYPMAKYLLDLLDDYSPEEAAADDEAVFIFVLDKVMPAFTHRKNGLVLLREHGIRTGNDLRESVRTTSLRIEPFRERFPLLVALREYRLSMDAKRLDEMCTDVSARLDR